DRRLDLPFSLFLHGGHNPPSGSLPGSGFSRVGPRAPPFLRPLFWRDYTRRLDPASYPAAEENRIQPTNFPANYETGAARDLSLWRSRRPHRRRAARARPHALGRMAARLARAACGPRGLSLLAGGHALAGERRGTSAHQPAAQSPGAAPRHGTGSG